MQDTNSKRGKKIITKKLLKVEIDKIQDKYLEILFKIIKALESSVETETSNQINPPKSDDAMQN